MQGFKLGWLLSNLLLSVFVAFFTFCCAVTFDFEHAFYGLLSFIILIANMVAIRTKEE